MEENPEEFSLAMVDAQAEENSYECATLVDTQVKCRRCGNVFLINSDLEKHMIFVGEYLL